MRLAFDRNGSPLPTYDLILAMESRLNALLKEHGIKDRNGNDWMHKAYQTVKDFQAHPENYEQPNQHHIAMYALLDCWEIGMGLRGARNESYDCIIEKLESLFKSTTNRNDSSNGKSRGRDTLFELTMLGDLKRASIQAQLGVANPDILVHTKKRDYFLECKRLSASSPAALQRNLHNASKQLRAHLTGDTRGVMCISVGEYITQGQSHLKAADDAHANKLMTDILEDFVKNDVHIWRNNNVMDECVAGTIIHTSILIEQDNLPAPVQFAFTLLGDALIYNTSGQRFSDFYDDFSTLSTSDNGRSVGDMPVFITYEKENR